MAPYAKLDSTTMPGTTYKTTIDGNSVAALRIVGKFLPHAQTSPNMTVVIDAGHIFDGATLTEVAAQTTAAFSAPVGHPRIDRIVVDNTTGAIAVVPGAEAVSPVPPAIPAGKSPVAQVAFTTSTSAITNAQITDERDFSASNAGGFGQQDTIASSATCDLGAVTSHNAVITGTATISSFGSSASVLQPIYLIEFSGTATLAHDPIALIIQGGVDLTTAAGDTAIAEYLGSGNWRVRNYERADGSSLLPFVADTGSGGHQGLVPAPAAGDAAAGKVLGASGNFIAPPSFVKAWVNFDGVGGVAINDSYNVASVTRNGLGDYTIDFTNPLPTASYAVSITTVSFSTGNTSQHGVIHGSNSGGPTLKTTTQLRILTGSSGAATLLDIEDISVVIFA